MSQVTQPEEKLIQITVTTRGQLYGLDVAGRVWKYVPSRDKEDGEKSFAFWAQLTNYRARHQ